MPELQVKVDMDDLAQKKDLNYAAVMAEMAKRSGFSLVTEDWDYFREYINSPQQWLKKGVQLDEMRYYSSRMRVDVQDKVIVPVVWDWVTKHQALAPASVVDTLVKKLNAGGVDLEDLLPVMFFTLNQWNEWVQGSKDLNAVGRHLSQVRDPIWQYFATLTPQDRAAAATPEGLSLGGFDPAVIKDLLTRNGKYLDMQGMPDDQGLAQLVLRLRSYSSQFYPSYSGAMNIPKDKVAPRGLDKTYSYSIDIFGAIDNTQKQYASSSGPYQLPFYSKEREIELIKTLVGDTKPNTPAPATLSITF
jgi:hypothetical protein